MYGCYDSMRPCPSNLDFSELLQSFGAPQPLRPQPGVSLQSGKKSMPPRNQQIHPEIFSNRQGILQTTVGVSPSVQQHLAQYTPQVQQCTLLQGKQPRPPSSQVICVPLPQQPPPASLSQVFSAPYPQQPLSTPSSQFPSASYSPQPPPIPSSQFLSSTYSQQPRPVINGIYLPKLSMCLLLLVYGV